MSLQSGDLKLSFIPNNVKTNQLECVLGKTCTFKINLGNSSLTDPIYNLGVTLTLPNGATFVSSSIQPNTNIINNSFKNIISFVNITDLYPNQLNYTLDFTIEINETFRNTGQQVAYGSVLNGFTISAVGDSKPRGMYDQNNIQITSTTETFTTVLRYSAKISGPIKHLKGAGNIPGPNTSDATSIFTISIELINSTRDSSNISFNLNLANGLRYIGTWECTGTDSLNFLNPIVYSVTESQDYVQIAINNETLSQGSDTIITFQVAIWDNLTYLGVENSGSLIINGQELINSITVTGNSTSFYWEYDIEALDLNLIETCSIQVTDVNVINEYTFYYEVTAYTSLYNVLLTYIIPDGMSYNLGSSSIQYTSFTINSDGTTTIQWNLGLLNASYSSSITLSTTTNSTYSTGNYVYSTDNLTDSLTIAAVDPITQNNISLNTYISLYVEAPSITTNVLGYFYSDLTQKTIDVAAVQDYVEFIIIYDATNLVAKQKNITLFDYPPLNISTANAVNINTTGDFPEGATYTLMPDNGASVQLGNLDGGTYLTISFYLPVTAEINNGMIYNLAKCSFINTNNIASSLRDNSIVYYGNPYLTVNNTISPSNCVSLNNEFFLEVVLNNLNVQQPTYTADAFNLQYTTTIPAAYTLIGTPVVTGTGQYGTLTVNNNILSLTVSELSPSDTITIQSNLQVSTLPIMGNEYPIVSSLTNGTSQASTTSYAYTDNYYPLSDTSPLTGCIPSITKVYNPSTVKLGDDYTITITVIFPKGCIAYNSKILDLLTSTDSSNITNVTLNGITSTYSISNNNIVVELNDILDTTSNSIEYILKYSNKTLTANASDYEDTLSTNSKVEWSNSLTSPESHSNSASADLNIVVPGIAILKKQQNITTQSVYDSNPLVCSGNDLINYKLDISNIGKSMAYNVIVTDTIPKSLRFKSVNIPTSTFNYSNKLLTVNLGSINPLENKELIIEAQVLDDNHILVASNNASASFKANSTLPNNYGEETSNSTIIYNNSISIKKLQRNLTNNEAFTSGDVRCFSGQSVQYQLIITNPYNIPLTNVMISDTFPNMLQFVSFNPFSFGTFTVTNNIVHVLIPSIAANTTINYIYTVKLNSDVLRRDSSNAIIIYNLANSLNSFTRKSNTTYLFSTGLGRGFEIH